MTNNQHTGSSGCVKFLDAVGGVDQNFIVEHSISHLLIVAAPSGAGKSTFISQLIAGQLPGEISEQIPRGAETWTQLSLSDISCQGLPALLNARKDAAIREIILHCDTVGRKIKDGKNFEEDPIHTIIEASQNITIVQLLVPAKAMISQLIYREVGIREPRQSSRLVWKCAHLIFTTASMVPGTLFMKYVSRRKNLKKRRQLWEKLRHYEHDGWLEAIYERWQQYLKAASSKGT